MNRSEINKIANGATIDTIVSATANISSAWLKQNKVNDEELDSVIRSVFLTLKSLTGNAETGKATSSEIEDTIHEDYIVCLEDGKKLRTLKRHIWSKYKLTVDDYKKKWGLPHDYPMVAPSYAKKRSDIAKYVVHKKTS